MAINVSQELFNAIVKASTSVKKGNFEDRGIWLDWDVNNGVLKGNFSIPIKQVLDGSTSTVKIVAEDFLNPE